MRAGEELLGRLAKFRHLHVTRLQFQAALHGGLGRAGRCRAGRPRVVAAVEVVREVEEDVVRGDGRGPALLAAEDEVDPLVQVRGHVLALQRCAVQAHELGRAAARPRRQVHVADALARTIVPPPQVESTAVAQKRAVAFKKLRYQFLEVFWEGKGSGRNIEEVQVQDNNDDAAGGSP